MAWLLMHSVTLVMLVFSGSSDRKMDKLKLQLHSLNKACQKKTGKRFLCSKHFVLNNYLKNIKSNQI